VAGGGNVCERRRLLRCSVKRCADTLPRPAFDDHVQPPRPRDPAGGVAMDPNRPGPATRPTEWVMCILEKKFETHAVQHD
jgi:hypothetical protein